ncbi:N-formylglutamate amidohydrolase [Pontibacter chitinilyticus]|uniref:N-formylglutamate amidohydrolase n=1 Tax=Pontibacter chitinilyticus TaxID=2674989 RepID=UPI00321931C9
MPQIKVDTRYYTITRGESPLVAACLHNGHKVRHSLKDLFSLTPEERLREEAPFTADWATVTDSRIIGHNSRFEMDLDRPPEEAVYKSGEAVNGLQVWKNGLPEAQEKESLVRYTSFYHDVRQMLLKLKQLHGCFVIYDLHTYNHKLQGPTGPVADPEENPEVNITTGNMNHERWAPVVEAFQHSLHAYNYQGRHLDVRQNVQDTGGHFMHWVHETFGDSACVISISVKKFFMDEWTGEPLNDQVQELQKAIAHTVPPVLEALAHVRSP